MCSAISGSLYKTEKPYLALLANGKEFYEKGMRLDNVEFQDYEGITVHDMRGNKDLTIEKCGFQMLSHKTNHKLQFQTMDDREAYKLETEELLRNFFDAVYVNTYDVTPRKNVSTAHRSRVDVLDPLYVEGPALGADNGKANCRSNIAEAASLTPIRRFHVEVGPRRLISKPHCRKISEAGLPSSNFQVRLTIFEHLDRTRVSQENSTWRPLHPVCRDRPLALCDCRSIDPEDLITADRVLPHAVGEVYFLGFNENQKWSVST